MPYLPENTLSAAEAVQVPSENVNLVDLIDQPAWKTVLLDLIKREKMDPWNIDIVELAEKYLQKINQLTKVNLRIPANAILASAILLKMKAKSLKISAIEEEEDLIQESPPQLLSDAEIPDLKGLRKLREGRVSLEELIETIDSVLEKTKKAEFKKSIKQLPAFTLPFSEENLSEKIENVFSKILERADSQGLLLFSQLLESKDSTEKVNTFIPMLFLINHKKISAWQDEWFGEIFVQILRQQNLQQN